MAEREAVTVFSWNTCDGLGNEQLQQPIVDRVLSEEPHLAIFPEAYREGTDDELLEMASRQFETERYQVLRGNYETRDNRNDKHGFMAISRLAGHMALRPIAQSNIVSISALELASPREFLVLGVHLDDRSEDTRLKQANSLLAIAGHSIDNNIPVVVAGDLNAMAMNDPRARFLRSRPVRTGANLLPSRDPGQSKHPNKLMRILERGGSLSQRLNGMASGTTHEMLTQEVFTDADSKNRPTMPSKLPIAALDHILASSGVEVLDHTVYPHDPSSDHRAIGASLRLR